jgi:hypothetical protein
MAVMLVVLGNEAMAVKVVAKSSNDSSQTKALPPAPNKPSETQAEKQPANPPSAEQKPAIVTPPQIPQPPRDNFIDRDNDGINDDIKQHREPQIKRDRVEPSKPIDTPKKSEPSKKNEDRKDDEKKTISKKH